MTCDLDSFLALPRVAGLALSPDGTRLVTSVAGVASDGKRFATALWQLDPNGQACLVRDDLRLARPHLLGKAWERPNLL